MKDLETEVQHFEPIELNSHNRPLTFPIYQSAKFEQDTFENFQAPQEGDYFYSRVSNPTVRQLEVLLAKLQGREDALAFASGVSSLAIPFLALLKAGDHVIFFAECYGPTRYLVRNFLEKFGVTHTLLFYDQANDLKKHLKPNTKLVHFESPTNPALVIPDISKITAIARAANVLTLMDNTLAGFHQHGEFEVDLFAHSLTKYASGHGDVMGGVIIGNKDLINRIRPVAINVGSTLDPHTSYLISRGMKTYFVRYRAQCASALEMAKYLRNHPKVQKVVYPGLEDHPSFALAKKQMKESGSIVFFDLAPEVDQAQFFNRLRYFRLAGSLGSTESLIVPCKKLFGPDLSEDELVRAQLNDTTMRVSIGLETVKDLIQDLELALM